MLRSILCVSLSACALAIPVFEARADISTSTKLVNDEVEIAKINSESRGWVAGHNEFFAGVTRGEAKKYLGAIIVDDPSFPVLNHTLKATAIPAAFDSRTQWPGLIHPIRNQAQCGSCWAFSASEALSDRFAIATGKASPVLSPEDLVSCDTTDMGCQGGRLQSAWTYLQNTGIVTDACFPYGAGAGTAPQCATKCADSEAFTKYKSKDAYQIKGVEQIQTEILTSGPVQVAFSVYSDFMTYKSGVYHKAWWHLFPEGGHAVKLIGWGTDSGQDYWLVANSWDTTWGEQGFFRIRRGTNECGIESQVFAGHAAV